MGNSIDLRVLLRRLEEAENHQERIILEEKIIAIAQRPDDHVTIGQTGEGPGQPNITRWKGTAFMSPDAQRAEYLNGLLLTIQNDLTKLDSRPVEYPDIPATVNQLIEEEAVRRETIDPMSQLLDAINEVLKPFEFHADTPELIISAVSAALNVTRQERDQALSRGQKETIYYNMAADMTNQRNIAVKDLEAAKAELAQRNHELNLQAGQIINLRKVNQSLHADSIKAIAELQEAQRKIKDLTKDLEEMRIQHANQAETITEYQEEIQTLTEAAHMAEDYQYGLPSWINQVLYHNYIGLNISPEIVKQIESGKLTFPNSPAEKKVVTLQEELKNANAQLSGLEKDREGWKQHWEMYRKAWIRELGGKIFNKTHEIDALVLTTRDMREKNLKLGEALFRTGPWSENRQGGTSANHCIHCGIEYDREADESGVPIEKLHKPDCIWVWAYQEFTAGKRPSAQESGESA